MTLKIIGLWAVIMLIWVGVAVHIAQTSFPQSSDIHGADFVQSDYQRCVTVHPGDIAKPRMLIRGLVDSGRTA